MHAYNSLSIDVYQYNDLCMIQLQSASFENDAAVAVKTVPDDACMSVWRPV